MYGAAIIVDLIMASMANLIIQVFLRLVSSHYFLVGIYESPLLIIKILDRMFHKLVVAVFITFVTFVVFAGIMSSAVAKTISSALVSSRLDYCNSRYHNIALNDILKLQRVQIVWQG